MRRQVLFLFNTVLFITCKYTSYTRRQVLFLFITALFITYQTHVLYAAASPISIHYCSIHYLSNTCLIRGGGKSYFNSLLLYSLLIKHMSYTRWQVLFQFITALFITYQTHVLYAVASPISIHYCSIHYLSNTCLIRGGKSYFNSLLLYSLLIKHMSYMRWQVLFLFITDLVITCLILEDKCYVHTLVWRLSNNNNNQLIYMCLFYRFYRYNDHRHNNKYIYIM